MMSFEKFPLLSKQRSPLFANRSLELMLIAAWILMQGFLFYQHGIFTGLEAAKYITEANNLLDHGNVSSPNFWLYSVQIFLIAAANKLHTGYISVVIVQLLFNGLATYSLYRLCLRFSNRPTAFLCLLLFIFNYPFQTFNTFLYTESLFYSFTILLSCYLLQLTRLMAGSLIKLVLFLLLICFTRPSGLLLVPCVFLYLFSRFFHSFSFLLKTGITIAITFIFVFLLNITLGSGGELDFLLPFREEHIICGVPTLTNPGTTPAGANSVWGIFSYVIAHPGQFARLAWLRTIAFFGLFRSYYSIGHNLYLGLYFFPVYLMVILSLRNWWNKGRSLLIYFLSLIGVTWGTVLLTCDDWHNRFFLMITPLLYILCLPALQKITALFVKKKISPDT
jgi:hypothetical protein